MSQALKLADVRVALKLAEEEREREWLKRLHAEEEHEREQLHMEAEHEREQLRMEVEITSLKRKLAGIP